MKIMTWNINGIRSVKRNRSLKTLFDSLDVDILCLQETKITREMLDEETAIVEGYNSYFSFSKVRSGYSGVATFCRDEFAPLKAENQIEIADSETNELDMEALNAEGRTVLTEHVDNEGNHVVIVNLYCPRADLENKERTTFKLQFYDLVQQKCRSLLAKDKSVIVLGDFNVSHKLIDHCDPDDPEIFDSNPSRRWASTFILDDPELPDSTTTKFVDSFRHFHPHQKSAFTCWSTMTGARQTNYGTRIDYIFSSVAYFKKQFLDCVIRPDIEGSDHCPVVATLKANFKSSAGKPPSLCTKYMPEFTGKQQKLKSFFQKKEVHKTENVTATESPGGNSVNKPSDSLKGIEKVAQKRSGSILTSSQTKRLKTTGNKNSQGSIFQFLSKPKKEIEHNLSKLEEHKKQGTACFEEKELRSHEQISTAENSSQSSSKGRPVEENSAAVVAQWKNLLKGPPPAPFCSGHNEPCVLRTVKNKGPNHGRQFHCCARPQGHSTNKDARCNFFKWINRK